MQKRPKIIVCQNDAVIKKRMKDVGIWPKMKELAKPGKTIAIVHHDELFLWHGALGDMGYSFFKSPLPGDLVLIAGMACNSSKQRIASGPKVAPGILRFGSMNQ